MTKWRGTFLTIRFRYTPSGEGKDETKRTYDNNIFTSSQFIDSINSTYSEITT